MAGGGSGERNFAKKQAEKWAASKRGNGVQRLFGFLMGMLQHVCKLKEGLSK